MCYPHAVLQRVGRRAFGIRPSRAQPVAQLDQEDVVGTQLEEIPGIPTKPEVADTGVLVVRIGRGDPARYPCRRVDQVPPIVPRQIL